jgi:hypothetical protein
MNVADVLQDMMIPTAWIRAPQPARELIFLTGSARCVTALLEWFLQRIVLRGPSCWLRSRAT